MKKFKSVLVFLLSLIIVFSAFPSTVFAKEHTFNKFEIYCGVKGGDVTVSKLPVTVSSTDIQSKCTEWTISFLPLIQEVKRDDSITLTLVTMGGSSSRYESFGKSIFYARFFNIDGISEELTVNASYDKNTSTFTAVLSAPIDCDYVSVGFRAENAVYSSSASSAFKWIVNSIDVSIDSAQTGLLNKITGFFGDLFARLTSWFDNLFQWLKDIRDGNISFAESVKTLFSNITNSIKGFFSELGTKLSDGFKNLTNSISTFFTNLGNNLKDWFDDVGQWFKDIGDRIGNFFSSLWDNISDSIFSITNAVSDWWQSVKDFFHSLFVPDDGFFDNYKQNWEKWAKEHFALFFDVEEIFDMLFGFFEGDDMEPGIVIPEIKLPFFNNPVIIPQTTFYFSQLLNHHPMIKRIYDLFQIAFSAIIYGLLLVYLQKTFSKIITNDEEAL